MRRFRRVIWGMAAIGLLAAAAGYRQYHRKPSLDKFPTARVRQGEFAVLVRCRGEIASRRSVQVSAPKNIPDLKVIWEAEMGSLVKAGETIMRFDASGAKRQLDENTAALRQAEGGLRQAVAQARITAEQDKLDLAKARYDVERARLEASKQAIVSVIQGEEAKIDLASAEAKLKVQQATVQLHEKSDEAKIASLTRQRDKAQADFDLTRSQLERMELKAPVDGYIAFAMNYSQGWMNARPFKVGDSVWSGALVAEIPEAASMEMQGRVDEFERGRIVLGNDVRVHLDSVPEQVFPAKLAAVSPLTMLSLEWPYKRNFRISASFEKGDSRLRPHMSGALDVVVDRLAVALSVPAKALFMRGGKPVVFVLDKQTGYRMVPVQVLARNPEEVAVSGVGAGSEVILVEPDRTSEAKS